MTTKALIVEDEEPARIVLYQYIKKHPEIEIIGEATDGFTAVKLINELRPDIIFHDIQLPKLNGFEIIELIDYCPIIIFTTAYDQYAIKAFEMNAVDYLLKPFSLERFNDALNKAINKINSNDFEKNKFKQLIEKVNESNEKIDRIVIKSGTSIKVFPLDQIIYIEAQDDYVMIYTTQSKHLKEKTMKYFETHLPQNQFIRIHRSYIVNIDYIVQIEHLAKETYLAILKNGTKLKISDSGYKLLRQRLNF